MYKGYHMSHNLISYSLNVSELVYNMLKELRRKEGTSIQKIINEAIVLHLKSKLDGKENAIYSTANNKLDDSLNLRMIVEYLQSVDFYSNLTEIMRKFRSIKANELHRLLKKLKDADYIDLYFSDNTDKADGRGRRKTIIRLLEVPKDYSAL